MGNEYKIEISMCPHPWDYVDKPYFWIITKNRCNNGHGWSKTPEGAWKEALEYYNKHIKE